MLWFPNAKVNLGLNVLSKREDGFHNLQSVLLPVGWSDILEILPSDDQGGMALSVTGLVPEDDVSNNLCVRAYDLLKDEFALEGVKAHLHKLIPSGAGLGGGSSNGAATLRMLNELFDLKLDKERLIELSANLGSDCPFFIENHPAWIEGRGERVQPINIPALSGKWIAIVNPGIHINTAEAFSEIEPTIPEWPIREALANPIEDWMGMITNDFEQNVFGHYPEVQEIRDRLLEEGAQYAAMSGTGSTVYGIFPGPNGINKLFPEYVTWEGPL